MPGNRYSGAANLTVSSGVVCLLLFIGEDETKVWCTLPPEDFRPYAIPFKLEGDTKVQCGH